MESLTVGTTVHFVYPDYTGDQINGAYPVKCHAAVVTRVLDEARGTVNLQWFDDIARNVARNVMFVATDQETLPKEGTWHWMEQHVNKKEPRFHLEVKI